MNLAGRSVNCRYTAANRAAILDSRVRSTRVVGQAIAAAALAAADVAPTRKVALRTSMVMSPDRGGIFDMLLQLVRRGLGGKAGSGRQFVSWIHEEDFVRSLRWLIDHEEVSGVVNLAAPEPLPNEPSWPEAARDLVARPIASAMAQ